MTLESISSNGQNKGILVVSSFIPVHISGKQWYMIPMDSPRANLKRTRINEFICISINGQLESTFIPVYVYRSKKIQRNEIQIHAHAHG